MKNLFIRRLHSLDNDVRASGFSKELERQFEEVRFRSVYVYFRYQSV